MLASFKFQLIVYFLYGPGVSSILYCSTKTLLLCNFFFKDRFVKLL